jgi:hypothetical protein
MQQKYGWKTDRNTRPILISTEQAAIRDHIENFTDITMILECLSFIYDENMRPDAMQGKHDDMLFSDMIAETTRWQQKVEAEPQRKLEGYFTPSELEDLGYKDTETPIKTNVVKSVMNRRRG